MLHLTVQDHCSKMLMPTIIAITGTPGVGKTTLAKKIIRKSRNKIVFFDIKKIAEQNNLILGKDKYGSKIIDIKKLQKIINAKVKKGYVGHTILMESHLLSDMKLDNALAIVLREHLKTLKHRLLKRKYPIEKIRDNIVCEATDYCGINACQNYRHVYELISSDKGTYGEAIKILFAKGKKRNKFVELGEELSDLISEDARFAI